MYGVVNQSHITHFKALLADKVTNHDKLQLYFYYINTGKEYDIIKYYK